LSAEAAPLVLVVEDEAPMRRFLRATLEAHGFRVFEAATAREGIDAAATRSPDIVLLDLGLPDLDGLEVTSRLRQWSSIPILVLSARGREEDKVRVLDAGADDYLTKPFGAGELLARIRVALRRVNKGGQEAPVFEAGALKVDAARRQVFVDGAEVHLTPLEYKLLSILVRDAGKVVTHRQLLREAWGPGSAEQTHYVRVYMAQLRRKLEADPARPRVLLTEPGVGYRLKG
jgi:two-component system, OmpR family, KDP operon response regulator KdpE